MRPQMGNCVPVPVFVRIGARRCLLNWSLDRCTPLGGWAVHRACSQLRKPWPKPSLRPHQDLLERPRPSDEEVPPKNRPKRRRSRKVRDPTKRLTKRCQKQGAKQKSRCQVDKQNFVDQSQSKQNSASKKSAASKKSTPARGGGKRGSMLVVVGVSGRPRRSKKYLGGAAKVMASVGHVKDLPNRKIGVDLENDARIRRHSRQGQNPQRSCARPPSRAMLYLAPDPDREGEAIAWHLADEIRRTKHQARAFNEITQRGDHQAIANPTDLDKSTSTTPSRRAACLIVWSGTRFRRSCGTRSGAVCRPAGSVGAVRIVVEREAEIDAFTGRILDRAGRSRRQDATALLPAALQDQ